MKCRDFSSSLSVRYIASTFHRVKLSETALPVKSRECCSFSDVNVLKINGGKDVHATIAHCEMSQDANEICSDFFDDSEQGKLLSNMICF